MIPRPRPPRQPIDAALYTEEGREALSRAMIGRGNPQARFEPEPEQAKFEPEPEQIMSYEGEDRPLIGRATFYLCVLAALLLAFLMII